MGKRTAHYTAKVVFSFVDGAQKVEKLFLEASYCHLPKAWASNVKAKRGRFAFCPKISYLCRSNGADREIFGDCSVAFCLFRGETTWDLGKITKDLGKIKKDLRKTTSYVVHFCLRNGFFYSLSREKWQPCKVTKMYTKMPFKKVYIKSVPACRQGPPSAPLLEKRRSPERPCRPPSVLVGPAHYAIRHPVRRVLLTTYLPVCARCFSEGVPPNTKARPKYAGFFDVPQKNAPKTLPDRNKPLPLHRI